MAIGRHDVASDGSDVGTNLIVHHDDSERVDCLLVGRERLLDLDLDLLGLDEILLFLMSAFEPYESAADDGERLRLRSLRGVTEREPLGDLRLRRGGDRGDRDREGERDFDSLGAGELDLP